MSRVGHRRVDPAGGVRGTVGDSPGPTQDVLGQHPQVGGRGLGISVKAEYDLSVTEAKSDAMVAHPEAPNCVGIEPFVEEQIPLMPELQEQASRPTPQPAPPAPEPEPAPVQPVAPVQPPVATYYRNCTAVWAAIGMPVYATDPGYANHLDGDGDGDCENRS